MSWTVQIRATVRLGTFCAYLASAVPTSWFSALSLSLAFGQADDSLLIALLPSGRFTHQLLLGECHHQLLVRNHFDDACSRLLAVPQCEPNDTPPRVQTSRARKHRPVHAEQDECNVACSLSQLCATIVSVLPRTEQKDRMSACSGSILIAAFAPVKTGIAFTLFSLRPSKGGASHSDSFESALLLINYRVGFAIINSIYVQSQHGSTLVKPCLPEPKERAPWTDPTTSEHKLWPR
ncbi:hypothetical protein NDA11_006979 [Ustilago hordei]|nr:hypothetical protein NDA11_006979 [Ustilago hordei]KAJ1597413.1 hypothetical protein NDA14_007172 [Ustilago hordei]UTT92115.1 hypothetical protein NDA17_000176 [Ustilago hordei]